MPDGGTAVIRQDAVVHVALRIGRGMLASGADATDVRRAVEDAIVAFGFETHTLIEAEAVLVTVQGADGFSTKIGRAIPSMAVDMGRLIALNRVLDAIAAGCRNLDDLNRRLDTVDAEVASYGLLAMSAGTMVTAACLCRLFGGDWPVVGAALVAGLVGTVLRRRLGRPGINATFAVFTTALGSGLAAALAIRLSPGSSPVLCLTAAGMVLVPGVPLINGVRDLVDGHAGTGVARLSLAVVTLLTIGFALYLAAGAAGDVLPVGVGPGRLPVAEDIVFSALVTIGYITLFNIPVRACVGCMICGVAGHGLRTSLESGGMDLGTASLLGALTAGLVAQAFAASWRVPAVVFAFPGVLAMMPGSYAFRAGIGGLHLADLGSQAPASLIAQTLALVLTTMLVTAAIAVGISIAFAIPRPSILLRSQ